MKNKESKELKMMANSLKLFTKIVILILVVLIIFFMVILLATNKFTVLFSVNPTPSEQLTYDNENNIPHPMVDNDTTVTNAIFQEQNPQSKKSSMQLNEQTMQKEDKNEKSTESVSLTTSHELINNILFNLIYMDSFLNKSYLEKLELEAIYFAKTGATENYAKAQYELGRIYETGKGEEKNLEEAIKWYTQASNQGYPEAQLALGKIYDKKNLEEAKELYKKAMNGFKKIAKERDIEAQLYLWYMYKNGLGREKNLIQSNYWYYQAINEIEEIYNNECMFIQYKLDKIIKEINDNKETEDNSDTSIKNNVEYLRKQGDMNYKGLGIIKDLQKASYYYERAAKKGDIESQFNLGYMYENGLGVIKDLEEANNWYTQASEGYVNLKKSDMLDIKGHIYLGYMYENGLGIRKNPEMAKVLKDTAKIKDYITATKVIENLNIFKQDSSNKNENITKLMYMHLNLDEQDLEEIRKIEFYFAEINANKGYIKAQYDLWYMYKNGLGVTKNLERATYWLEETKKKYNKGVQLYLEYINFNILNDSKMLEEIDYKKIFECFKRLAEQGDVEASFYLRYIYENGLGVIKDETQERKYYNNVCNYFREMAKTSYEVAQKNLEIQNLENEEVENKDSDNENSDSEFYTFLMKLGDGYYSGVEVEKDYKKAFELYEKIANQGHAEAQKQLGNMYYLGQGVEKDYKKAFEWYEKSANQGYAKAQNNLGIIYKNGRGVKQDYKKAVELYEKSANQGCYEGQFNLGDMYYKGQGVEKDYKKAFEWYEKSANQGYEVAQYNLGVMYKNGQGVDKDYKKAFEWYEKSANQGYAKAQNDLGVMYYNGHGVKQDYKKAVELYEKSANQGCYGGQFNLGDMYYKGQGVEKDYKKAFELYEKSAKQGCKWAQYNLGVMYKNGQGVDKDYKKAFEWYEKSAKQGYEVAQNDLGDMYYNGQGIEKDYKKAFEWYEKSANQGNSQAQCKLGNMYYKGEGVEKDYNKAKEWYEKSAKQGNIDAQNMLLKF